jgi:hypothetical protein
MILSDCSDTKPVQYSVSYGVEEDEFLLPPFSLIDWLLLNVNLAVFQLY